MEQLPRSANGKFWPIPERKHLGLPVLPFAAATLLLTVACSQSPTAAPKPTDRWLELLLHTPFPYTTPLPPDSPTELDGVYVKHEPKEGTPVPCRRCPDYLPEGGVWKLHLDNGVYRIYHPGTGWRSLGSFTARGVSPISPGKRASRHRRRPV